MHVRREVVGMAQGAAGQYKATDDDEAQLRAVHGQHQCTGDASLIDA
jgi:hypothetical protein